MPFEYKIADAIKDAGKSTGISASMITQVVGDASKSQTHADAHMKSEDFWTTQRTVGEDTVGGTAGVDDHLKSAYKKRMKHSMFDSAFSSVEAITAALNCPLGVAALTTLLGNSDDDGVDLYSRTAVATFGDTSQFVRSNPGKTASSASTMDKTAAEYVVVCLRKAGDYLIIASAYPVASSDASKLEHAGNDWYQSQKTKTVVRELKSVSPAIVNW